MQWLVISTQSTFTRERQTETETETERAAKTVIYRGQAVRMIVNTVWKDTGRQTCRKSKRLPQKQTDRLAQRQKDSETERLAQRQKAMRQAGTERQ